jgi:hypothetical protein
MKNMPLATLPGGAMFVDQNNPHGGIRSAFDVKLDINHQLEDIRDVRQRIKETFYVDLFLMLAQASRGRPADHGARGRGEARGEAADARAGVERLDNELLKPKIDITFDRIIEADLLRDNPRRPRCTARRSTSSSSACSRRRSAPSASAAWIASSDHRHHRHLPAQLGARDHRVGQARHRRDRGSVRRHARRRSAPDRGERQGGDHRKNRADTQAKQQQVANAVPAAKAAKDLAAAGPSGQQAVDDIIGKFSGYSGPGLPTAA